MSESKSGSSLELTVDQSPADLERAQLLSQHARPPGQVEGYQIERCLGAGAFGTVWLAMQNSTGKIVAIKFYEHRGGLDWALLHREVEKLAVLYTDRDIVQLIDVGWDSSPPYYVMEYLERGSLEQLLRQGPMPVTEAVRIVRGVAQALVHAHGRGILHCDLKPANVLLDNDWRVRLADFGQSRLSYEQLPALGTLFYMAPEQADLKAAPDARWDVYALGALLYHLIIGNPPYRTAESESRLRDAPNLTARLEEYRRTIAQSPRPTEHRQMRGVDRTLAETVERCLEPNPARRLPNAQAVLDALDHRARQRARRPLIALGLVAPLLLLAATVALGVLGWRDAVRNSEASLVRAVQAGNVYAAQGVANTVLLQLHKLSHTVEHTSEGAELRDLLGELRGATSDADKDRVRDKLQESLVQIHADSNGPQKRLAGNGEEDPFESWVIMDPDGVILARSPRDKSVIGRDFAWRDYYRGPFRQADEGDRESAYISRVFRSESDKLYKFAISTLVRAGNGSDSPVLGVLVATITTGTLPLHDERRTAVLIGRWDTNQRPGTAAGTARQPENLILRHPAYRRGAAARELRNDVLDAVHRARETRESLESEQLMADDYHDPLAERSEKYGGRWLAGFAPVGATHFVVIVQQQYDEAVNPVNTLARELAERGWLALSLGVVILGVIWYFVQRAMNWSDRVGAAGASSGALPRTSGSTELMQSQAGGKSEIRNSKSETNSNPSNPKSQNAHGGGASPPDIVS